MIPLLYMIAQAFLKEHGRADCMEAAVLAPGSGGFDHAARGENIHRCLS